MSDPIGHECGVALIRLKQPLSYYAQKYGTPLYAFNKMFLLMEKQHNRGQDGAGIGCVKLDVPLGKPFMFRERELDDNSLARLFRKQLKRYDKLVRRNIIYPELPDTVKDHFDFGGEVLIGHLRYGTSGTFSSSSCHPYSRRSNWPTRNLMVCGNFNMTNTAELNRLLIKRGQHPIFDTDTQTILEGIGFHLDEAHDRIYREMRDSGMPGEEIPGVISKRLDLVDVLTEAASSWDGGYTIGGVVGNGDAFFMRDPAGIRPAHYFENDELIAFASERVPLMTVFDLDKSQVTEVPPGHLAEIKADGTIRFERFAESCPRRSCTFERIYFSRGNDPDIYQERKALGAALAPKILEAIDNDLENSVFSFIPNTAETASYGLLQELRRRRREMVKHRILEAQKDGPLTPELLDELIMANWPRVEKIAHKDIKLRTFISQESNRSRLVSHIYDITYDVVRPGDTLIVIDDSIVRGTTLRDSIIKILARAQPHRIIITSTAPQIRYPDCYGIDMSEIWKFVAFQAAVALLRETGGDTRLRETYDACRKELAKAPEAQENRVKDIYAPFSPEEISAKIAELIRPKDIDWGGQLDIIFQGIDALHRSTPGHTGDWYFTGNYPTPGGYAVVNQAYVNFYENRSGRSYEA